MTDGGTVTVGGDFALDLLYQSGAAVDVETIGVFAGGALTVAVIPQAELTDGAYAAFNAVPESGAAGGAADWRSASGGGAGYFGGGR